MVDIWLVIEGASELDSIHAAEWKMLGAKFDSLNPLTVPLGSPPLSDFINRSRDDAIDYIGNARWQ